LPNIVIVLLLFIEVMDLRAFYELAVVLVISAV